MLPQPGRTPVTHSNGQDYAAFRDREQVRLVVRFLQSLGAKPTTLNLVGRDRNGLPLAVCMQLPSRDASIQVTDCSTGHRVGLADFRGHSLGGVVALPMTIFAPDRPLFAKLRRRHWFFDKAGWMEIQSAPIGRKRTLLSVQRTFASA